jgi:hypothetical protein
VTDTLSSRRCDAPPTRWQRKPVLRRAAALLALTAWVPLAHATLGLDRASVDADRAEAQASVREVPHAAFAVHELSTGSHGIVREYVSPEGQVFAITWHGPAKPNLRQLLGVQFDALAAAAPQPHTRGHMAARVGNLVFESTGRMRSFNGRAYLSNALPAGVSTHDIE